MFLIKKQIINYEISTWDLSDNTADQALAELSYKKGTITKILIEE